MTTPRPPRFSGSWAGASTSTRRSGWCCAALIAVLLVRGGSDAFRLSLLLMFVATIVDATDGTLARLVRIKEVVPSFDGRRLDDLIDFLTYTFLPLLLIWRAGLLPPGQEAWLLFPLVASAYGFCQVQAKTDDGYFLGFPSLWNVVAIYLYVLPLAPWLALLTVIILALLTFVPSRYLYPSSQPGRLNVVATVPGVPWGVLVVWLIWNLPTGKNPRLDATSTTLAFVSLSYPIFYMGASWYITLSSLAEEQSRGLTGSPSPNPGLRRTLLGTQKTELGASLGVHGVELLAENQIAPLAEQADDLHERAPVFVVPQMELHQELLDREPRESPGREDLRQCRHLSPFNVDLQNINMTMSQLGGDLAEAFDLAFLVFEDQIIGLIAGRGKSVPAPRHGTRISPCRPVVRVGNGQSHALRTVWGRSNGPRSRRVRPSRRRMRCRPRRRTSTPRSRFSETGDRSPISRRHRTSRPGPCSWRR